METIDWVLVIICVMIIYGILIKGMIRNTIIENRNESEDDCKSERDLINEYNIKEIHKGLGLGYDYLFTKKGPDYYGIPLRNTYSHYSNDKIDKDFMCKSDDFYNISNKVRDIKKKVDNNNILRVAEGKKELDANKAIDHLIKKIKKEGYTERLVDSYIFFKKDVDKYFIDLKYKRKLI